MSKISKKSLTVVLVIAVVALFSGLKLFQKTSQPSVSEPAPANLPQRAEGNPNAAIKIIEFIDFQCPACAKGYKSIKDYLGKYPDKIYVELRYFPLVMHKHGQLSARWGECAARQNKFWPFLDHLIDQQSIWASMNDPLPAFREIAKEAGVDQDKVNACLNDPNVDKVIAIDVEEGKMRAVTSTPSYFINHEMIVGTKSLKSTMDELLGIKTETKTP